MLKAKSSKRVMFNKGTSEMADTNFILNGDIVKCQVCNKQISCDKKSQITRHVNSAVHKRNVQWHNSESSASNSQQSSGNEFYIDLCHAMVVVKMPWRCVDNVAWRNFLKKYTNQNIPNEPMLRKNYLQQHYQLTIQTIRADIAEHNIWILVDETTDNTGSYIANLIDGKICVRETAKPHLLT